MNIDEWLKSGNKLDSKVHIKLEGPDYKSKKISFELSFNLSPIKHLIEDSKCALRVFELISITRPADILQYLWIEFDELPAEFLKQYEYIVDDKNHKYRRALDWPDKSIPFKTFDGFSFWSWDEVEPEQECWLLFRESQLFRDLCLKVFKFVEVTKSNLRKSKELMVQKECELIDHYKHSYQYKNKLNVHLTRPDYSSGAILMYSNEYYEKLNEILSTKAINSVAYRIPTDFSTIKLLCGQQYLRNSEKYTDKKNYRISILDDDRNSVSDEWEVSINWSIEGLIQGDLYIEQNSNDSESMEELIYHYGDAPNYIYHVKDAGNIRGYTKEKGNDWVLYIANEMIEH